MCPKSAHNAAVGRERTARMSKSTMSTTAATTTTTSRLGQITSHDHRNTNNDQNTNKHSLASAGGNIYSTSGAIRIDNNQVNGEYENSEPSLRISHCQSCTAKKERRIALASQQLLLTLLISVAFIFIQQTTSATINTTMATKTTATQILSPTTPVLTKRAIESANKFKQTTKKFINSTAESMSLISLIESAMPLSVQDTLPATNAILPSTSTSPAPPPPSPITEPKKPKPIPLPTATTKTFPTSELPVEISTMDGLGAAATNNYVNDIRVKLQPPTPPSDVLTKGFSIPTFLPPFPAFAMADLPAYTSAPITAAEATSTLPTDPQDQLYLAVYKQSSAAHDLAIAETNITVQLGNHAYLPCNIQRISDKPISWVRLRDGHILSVDQATFIADQRFQSIFQGENNFTWSLQIKYVQDDDEGWYECQTSSEPKISAKVYLAVVVPHTELIGDQNRFVKAGSKVALHCIVRDTLEAPTYIIWFRGKTQITDNNELGWYTEIDRTIFGDVESNRNTIGSLIIPFVRKGDSGNYTCQPSNSAPVHVDLHVLSGEYSASAIMSAATTYKQIYNNMRFSLLSSMLLLVARKT